MHCSLESTEYQYTFTVGLMGTGVSVPLIKLVNRRIIYRGIGLMYRRIDASLTSSDGPPSFLDISLMSLKHLLSLMV